MLWSGKAKVRRSRLWCIVPLLMHLQHPISPPGQMANVGASRSLYSIKFYTQQNLRPNMEGWRRRRRKNQLRLQRTQALRCTTLMPAPLPQIWRFHVGIRVWQYKQWAWGMIIGVLMLRLWTLISRPWTWLITTRERAKALEMVDFHGYGASVRSVARSALYMSHEVTIMRRNHIRAHRLTKCGAYVGVCTIPSFLVSSCDHDGMHSP